MRRAQAEAAATRAATRLATSTEVSQSVIRAPRRSSPHLQQLEDKPRRLPLRPRSAPTLQNRGPLRCATAPKAEPPKSRKVAWKPGPETANADSHASDTGTLCSHPTIGLLTRVPSIAALTAARPNFTATREMVDSSSLDDEWSDAPPTPQASTPLELSEDSQLWMEDLDAICGPPFITCADRMQQVGMDGLSLTTTEEETSAHGDAGELEGLRSPPTEGATRLFQAPLNKAWAHRFAEVIERKNAMKELADATARAEAAEIAARVMTNELVVSEVHATQAKGALLKEREIARRVIVRNGELRAALQTAATERLHALERAELAEADYKIAFDLSLIHI